MEELLAMLDPRMVQNYELLTQILPTTNAMDFPTFVVFYCMLLEEWCFCHDAKITEVIRDIVNIIDDANKKAGRYGYSRSPSS